ncbi:hypothetical protein EYC98_02560 [Halieaceae bacterium IMCC14734]|uniref:VPLPA-CTERM sorting domain-containing protein n=1 Tax=Candidatus Litorirhabdus singularis TaxID=2518993 RepID=A0ABT3TD82_9GAMM|nr:VPLPA-CTERM sorting domain-containing protein [Candidatus Litorirhabdus singularis]MCX2979741.1 hypothetical protein [Candidatus Litorirhabdus singularis]
MRITKTVLVLLAAAVLPLQGNAALSYNYDIEWELVETNSRIYSYPNNPFPFDEFERDPVSSSLLNAYAETSASRVNGNVSLYTEFRRIGGNFGYAYASVAGKFVVPETVENFTTINAFLDVLVTPNGGERQQVAFIAAERWSDDFMGVGEIPQDEPAYCGESIFGACSALSPTVNQYLFAPGQEVYFIFSSLLFSGLENTIASKSMDIELSTQFPISQVPIPAAAWLFGSAILGLIGAAKRKKA